MSAFKMLSQSYCCFPDLALAHALSLHTCPSIYVCIIIYYYVVSPKFEIIRQMYSVFICSYHMSRGGQRKLLSMRKAWRWASFEGMYCMSAGKERSRSANSVRTLSDPFRFGSTRYGVTDRSSLLLTPMIHLILAFLGSIQQPYIRQRA